MLLKCEDKLQAIAKATGCAPCWRSAAGSGVAAAEPKPFGFATAGVPGHLDMVTVSVEPVILDVDVAAAPGSAATSRARVMYKRLRDQVGNASVPKTFNPAAALQELRSLIERLPKPEVRWCCCTQFRAFETFHLPRAPRIDVLPDPFRRLCRACRS